MGVKYGILGVITVFRGKVRYFSVSTVFTGQYGSVGSVRYFEGKYGIYGSLRYITITTVYNYHCSIYSIMYAI